MRFQIGVNRRSVSPGSSCKDAENECGGGSYCNPDNDVCSCPSETMDEAGVCMHIKMSGTHNNSFVIINL